MFPNLETMFPTITNTEVNNYNGRHWAYEWQLREAKCIHAVQSGKRRNGDTKAYLESTEMRHRRQRNCTSREQQNIILHNKHS